MTVMLKDNARRAPRDGGIQLADGLTAFTYPLPPAGFDPAAASDGELAQYGLPGRPADPRRREEWEHRMRGSRVITPVFRLLADPAPALGSGVRPLLLAAAVSDHYSGATIAPRADGRIDDMSAGFLVPNVFPQPGVGAGEWSSACPWVGAGDDAETNLFKLGCDCRCLAAGDGGASEVQIIPFWQWLPAGRFSIPNFPVAAGDLLYVILLPQGTLVSCFMDNRTRAAVTTFDIAVPAELRNRALLSGKLGAWMVERLPDTELARFGEVFFSDAVAAGPGQILDLKTADRVTMRASVGSAEAQVLPPDLVRVVRSL